MASSFLICFLWVTTTCIGLLFAEHKIVLGQEKSDIVLPCTLLVVSDAAYVRWSVGDKDVFERSGSEWFQGEGYESRVDVCEKQLREGNCSLVIKNLTLADTGVYKSYQALRRTKRSAFVREKWELINSVELSVDGQEKKTVPATRVLTDAAGINWPHPLLMCGSLLCCFLSQLLHREP